MKKIAIFACALLVSLPGCRKDQAQPERQSQTEQGVNTLSSEGDYYYDDIEMRDNDELGMLFDFDEDTEEFVAENDADYRSDYDMSDSQDIAWIDAQMDDDIKPLFFEFNKQVLSTTQKEALTHNIEQVKQLLADAGDDTKAIVVAEGHTCQEGSREYNIALSENRAKHIADFLVESGVDKDSIKIVGRGQENPLVEGSTRAERAPNRRVEMRVIYT